MIVAQQERLALEIEVDADGLVSGRRVSIHRQSGERAESRPGVHVFGVGKGCHCDDCEEGRRQARERGRA